MKNILYSFLAFTIQGFSQAVPDNIRATNVQDAINQIPVGVQYLYTIPEKSGQVVGDVYLTNDWKKTLLQVYKTDKVIGTYSCKLNLYTKQIEIKDGANVKFIDNDKIRSLAIAEGDTKKYLVSGKDYLLDQAPLTDFLEVLVDGSLPLFQRTTLVVVRPNYNQALNIGSKDTKLVKKESLFLAKEKTLIPVKGIKKNYEKIFENKADEVRKFVRRKSIKLSKKEDLITLFEFYNSLTK
jgi:hypothetical protein